MHQVWKLLFTLAFALSTCLLGFGLYSNHLFSQQIWVPASLAQFFIVLLACTIWFTAGWFLLGSYILSLSALLMIIYGAAIAGIAAVLGLLYFLFSSWCLGRLVGQNAALALAFGICFYAWLIGIVALFPINYPLFYFALFLLAPIYVGLTSGGQVLREAFTRGLLGRHFNSPSIVVVAIVLILHFLVVLKPEISQDGLAMHLAIPASVHANHQYVFSAQETAWAVMPMVGDWSFTAVYMLGREAAARLLNYSLLIVIIILINQCIQKSTPPRFRYLLLALFLSSPIVQLVTGSLFVENFWAMNLLAAFVACITYWESGRISTAVVSGMLLGIAVATKFGSIAFVVPLLVFLWWSLRYHCQTKWIIVVSGLVFIFGGLHYTRAFLETGNPVYPFLNDIFKSPYVDSAAVVDTRFTKSLSLTTLYDLTFMTSDFLEAQNGGWAFQYLFFLPIACLCFCRRRDVVGYLTWSVSIAFFILTLLFQPNARYLYPALPLFTLLIGSVATDFIQSHFTGGYYLASVAGVLTMALNIWFLPASGWYHKDFAGNVVWTQSRRDRYLKEGAPVRLLVDYLNLQYPGQPVAFWGNNHIAGLYGKAFTATWHNPDFDRNVRSLQSADACFRLMDKLHIERFIVPLGLKRMPHPPAHFFSISFSPPEMTSGNWKIVRLEHPSVPNTSDNHTLRTSILKPGIYDDSDDGIVYRGNWTNDYQSPLATDASLTYSNQTGATINIRFSGQEVTLVFTKAYNRGRANISIDGVEKGIIDSFSPQIDWQKTAVYSSLGIGNHTLELRVLGSKDSNSKDSYVDLDGVIIR